MRIAFLHADKPRERLLAEALCLGARCHGDAAEPVPMSGDEVPPAFDVAAMVGVKSRSLFQACRRGGLAVVYLDKGYTRHRRPGGRTWEYWRVAVNDHHPTAYLMAHSRSADRLAKLRLAPQPFRPWTADGHVLFAGSSQKNADWYGLGDAGRYAAKQVRRLRKATRRPIVYRAKPSWRDAAPVRGARFSRPAEPLGAVLAGAHAVVTHNSNACFDALLAGVPVVALGPAVARPLAAAGYDGIDALAPPTEAARAQWLANLAWCQWTEPEMASGEMWAATRPLLFG